MPKEAKGESCAAAIRAALEPGEIVPFADLFKRIKRRGKWSPSTIWQHLMSLVVNLPPARHQWPGSKPFLFLHADGRYELHQNNLSTPSKLSATPEGRDLARGRLIEHHLKLDKILDIVDSKKLPNEGIAARVSRLRDSDLLPRNIACLMLTVNSLRNMVVHDGFVMGPHETAVVENAMAAIEAWSQSKGARPGKGTSRSRSRSKT